MHFDFIEPIFQRIGDGNALVGELAFLANGHESGRDLMCDCTAENETARLDACNLVDLGTGPGLHQLIHRAPKRPRIAKERRDISEDDARLRIIGNGSYRRLEIVLELPSPHATCHPAVWVAVRSTLAKRRLMRNHRRLDG